MIRADRFAQRELARLPEEQRRSLDAALPAGAALHVTHGGRQYTASIRSETGAVLATATAGRVTTACSAALAALASA